MSVNRFLYATNFVVSAPANRPNGPLVHVTNKDGGNLLKVNTIEKDGTGRNELILDGQFTGQGNDFVAQYSNLVDISGSNMKLTSNTANFALSAATLSGATLLADFATSLDLKAQTVFVSGPIMNVVSDTADFALKNATLSGDVLLANYGTSLDLKAQTVFVSGPIMNVVSDTADFALKNATLSGDVLLANYGTSLDLKAQTVFVSGPIMNVVSDTADFALKNATLSGDVLLANYGTSLDLKAQTVFVSGPIMNVVSDTADFALKNATLSGDVLLANYGTSLDLKAQTVFVSGPIMNVVSDTADFALKNATLSGDVLLANYGTSLDLKAQTVFVSGPIMNVVSDTADFALKNATLSGDVLLANYATSLDLKAQTVFVSGPIMNVVSNNARFDLNTATLSGATLLAQYTDANIKSNNVNFKSNDDRTIVHVDEKGMTVEGILIVKGDMVTYNSNEVLLGDSHIGLNARHRLSNDMGGGMTVVNKALSSFNVTDITPDPAGAFLNVTVKGLTGADFTLPTNAIIQISEASMDGANGYYILEKIEVGTVVGSVVAGVDAAGKNTYTIKPSTLSAANGVGTFKFTLKTVLPNEVFLPQLSLTLSGEDMWLSHVQMTDLRLDPSGNLSKAYGNTADFTYYAVGSGSGSYENVKNSSLADMDHPITKSVTVCEKGTGIINLILPDIIQELKGAEYKIINKQQAVMKITVNNAAEHINGYFGTPVNPSHVDVLASMEDEVVKFIATITDDGVIPVVKGWQML